MAWGRGLVNNEAVWGRGLVNNEAVWPGDEAICTYAIIKYATPLNTFTFTAQLHNTTNLMLLEHGVTVDEALLEGHPGALQLPQQNLLLFRNLNLVLTENVELVLQWLKLGLNVWYV